jgi:hypothetical protein
VVLPSTSLFDCCQWLQQTPLATAINESIWLFPLIEGSHVLALPISVGMIVLFDLHLLGLATGSKVTKEFLRWSRFGFAVMLIHARGGLLLSDVSPDEKALICPQGSPKTGQR